MPRTLSTQTEELLGVLSKVAIKTKGEVPHGEPIRVSTVTRGLGFLYEKVRNALDYHEEHLLAKNAIYRVLRRRFYEILSGKKIGRLLLEELIRGRYLENNTILEGRADEVDRIIDKYREVFNALAEHTQTGMQERELRTLELWFLSLGAVEIEELLHQAHQDRAYITFFYRTMKTHLDRAPEFENADLDLQLYLASYRSILLADEAMESYTLFRLYFPEWDRLPRPEFIKDIVAELGDLKKKIELKLKQPIRNQLDRIFKRRSLLVLLLRDLIDDNPEGARQVLDDPNLLEQKLHQLYDQRYKMNRARLQRSAFRAVTFIFVTKMALALGAEIPYELARTANINFLALGLNTFLPPLLLIGAAMAIRMPGEQKSFLQIMIDFEKMISGGQEPVVLDALSSARRRSPFLKMLIGVLYALNFGITFLLLWWILNILHFTWLSAALFVFFLSLVSFFALRLRKAANELVAIEEKEHTVMVIIDFLIFPIVEIGRLLSLGLRSINVIAFLFDFLIETPVKTVVEILEEWFRFLRERRQAI